jgi:hypothetical protein
MLGRAAEGRAGLNRSKDAVRRDVQEHSKNAVLLETMRENELVAKVKNHKAENSFRWSR